MFYMILALCNAIKKNNKKYRKIWIITSLCRMEMRKESTTSLWTNQFSTTHVTFRVSSVGFTTLQRELVDVHERGGDTREIEWKREREDGQRKSRRKNGRFHMNAFHVNAPAKIESKRGKSCGARRGTRGVARRCEDNWVNTFGPVPVEEMYPSTGARCSLALCTRVRDIHARRQRHSRARAGFERSELRSNGDTRMDLGI